MPQKCERVSYEICLGIAFGFVVLNGPLKCIDNQFEWSHRNKSVAKELQILRPTAAGPRQALSSSVSSLKPHPLITNNLKTHCSKGFAFLEILDGRER